MRRPNRLVTLAAPFTVVIMTTVAVR